MSGPQASIRVGSAAHSTSDAAAMPLGTRESRKTSNCHMLTEAQFGPADADLGAGCTTQIELERQRRAYRVCRERSRGSDAASCSRLAPIGGSVRLY